MPEPRSLHPFGNGFMVLFDDGSKKHATPTGGSLWLFAGGGAQTGPGPGPGPTPGGDGKFVAPFSFENDVSSEYGPRSGRVHQGIDFGYGAALEGADIHAAFSGEVIVAETGHYTFDGSGFGNHVIINHGVIAGVPGVREQQQVFTVYGHMLAPGALVSVGQTVSTGDLLGKVGNTGNSYGAHLHWETHIAAPGGNISWSNPGSHMNPRDFMVRYG